MNQLAMAFDARDAGIQQSADHAEAESPGWSERAYTELMIFAFGRTFTSEDFRDHLKAIGFPVPVPKALGAVFVKAARKNKIQRVGFARSRERHCSTVPLWGAA